jgi:hypothetical protein
MKQTSRPLAGLSAEKKSVATLHSRDNGQWLDIADGAIILTSGLFAEQPEVDGLPALAALAIVRASAT